MEMERGGYHALLRLRFEVDASPILALAIVQNCQCGFFKPFLYQIPKHLIPILTSFNKDGNGTWCIPCTPETRIRDGYLAHPSSRHHSKYIQPIKLFSLHRATNQKPFS